MGGRGEVPRGPGLGFGDPILAGVSCGLVRRAGTHGGVMADFTERERVNPRRGVGMVGGSVGIVCGGEIVCSSDDV